MVNDGFTFTYLGYKLFLASFVMGQLHFQTKRGHLTPVLTPKMASDRILHTVYVNVLTAHMLNYSVLHTLVVSELPHLNDYRQLFL